MNDLLIEAFYRIRNIAYKINILVYMIFRPELPEFVQSGVYPSENDLLVKEIKEKK
jgi:hypothetical protein